MVDGLGPGSGLPGGGMLEGLGPRGGPPTFEIPEKGGGPPIGAPLPPTPKGTGFGLLGAD